MSHQCKSLIVHCMDFRLGEAIKNWLNENHLLNNCDLVSLAGAVKGLINETNLKEAQIILKQIEISVSLHGISQIILMNHTDCGAYGGRESFESSEMEQDTHVRDMKKAKEVIVQNFPDLEIKLILAKMNPLGQISFEEVA
ncbi:MAG TPA: hypothetical protein PKY08_01660 [Candidatus Magasanikbacteria bacterium]|nr:hypothetical protein [Candidatus Magasanikbacteria bacterium]